MHNKANSREKIAIVVKCVLQNEKNIVSSIEHSRFLWMS